MMKSQIKDIVIGIFAVIGFTAIVMGFNNPTSFQQVNSMPESHVWEIKMAGDNIPIAFMYNKKTGEVRRMSTAEMTTNSSGKIKLSRNYDYIKLKEVYY